MSVNSLTYSQNGLNLTEQFEGLRLEAYQDVVGVWTIGYGHTGGVTPGMTCTQEQANDWLSQDVQGASHVVNTVVQVQLNQNQFDALVDFVFNLGAGNFQSSTLLRLINQGNFTGAANQFPLWNHAGGVVVAGLTERRIAEQKLFLTIPTTDLQPTLPAVSTGVVSDNLDPPVTDATTVLTDLTNVIKQLQDKFSS
jgi:lysozyme